MTKPLGSGIIITVKKIKHIQKEIVIMFKVQTFTYENGHVIKREQIFYAIEAAMKCFFEVQSIVAHGKLIIHNRVAGEF